MKLIRFFFRILMAPVALLMTTFLVPLTLLLALSTRVLAIISTIGVLLAFLISPYGLPMIAEWLWKRLADVRGVMWRFVFG